METTPCHFFSDCLEFEDPNSYQSPDQDAGSGSIALQPFNPCDSKFAIDGSPVSVDPRDQEPRADVWEGFEEQFGSMATANQKPFFVVDPGLYSMESGDEDVKAQIQVAPTGTSVPSTRRTSSSKCFSQRTSNSGSASTGITPPEQEPPKRRKVKKVKKESSTAEEEQKRSKFLERNRIAASKCREKKKQFVSELEDTKVSLETQHAQLQMEYNTLIDEISGLKHHLMAHAKCNDANIDRWLNNEARKFVQTTNEFFRQTFGPYGPPSQPALSTGSPRSRNPSISSSYPSLQSVQYELASGERQGSIAYSHGSASLYTSPTDETFPCLSPALKREPGINYDHMPDSMFSSDQPGFGGG